MLGIGLSLSKSSVSSPKWVAAVNAFKTKVEGDGGTLESSTCIRNDVKFLMQNP